MHWRSRAATLFGYPWVRMAAGHGTLSKKSQYPHPAHRSPPRTGGRNLASESNHPTSTHNEKAAFAGLGFGVTKMRAAPNPPFLRSPLHLSRDTPSRVPGEGPPSQRALEPHDNRFEPVDKRLQPRRSLPNLAGTKLGAAGGGALHHVGETDPVALDKHRDGGSRSLTVGAQIKRSPGTPGGSSRQLFRSQSRTLDPWHFMLRTATFAIFMTWSCLRVRGRTAPCPSRLL